MKLTKEQINKIKELKKQEKTAKEIAIELKIPISTVEYYYNEANKIRQINYQGEYQKKNPPKRGERYKEYQREYHKRPEIKKYQKEYQKKYQKERYNNDEEFREKIKKKRKERYLRMKKENKI